MSYLVFQSEALATAGELQIVDNIRTFMESAYPERMSPEGYVYSVNASTGAVDTTAQQTEAWDVPTEYVEGWAIVCPEASVFGEAVLDGVVDYTIASEVTPLDPIPSP